MIFFHDLIAHRWILWQLKYKLHVHWNSQNKSCVQSPVISTPFYIYCNKWFIRYITLGQLLRKQRMQMLFTWQWYLTERQSCHFSWIQMQADWSCWNMELNHTDQCKHAFPLHLNLNTCSIIMSKHGFNSGCIPQSCNCPVSVPWSDAVVVAGWNALLGWDWDIRWVCRMNLYGIIPMKYHGHDNCVHSCNSLKWAYFTFLNNAPFLSVPSHNTVDLLMCLLYCSMRFHPNLVILIHFP